jgi:hypothetical protein
MPVHDLSDWDEIVREYKNHQYYSISLIIRKAEEKIAKVEREDVDDLIDSETPFENLDDLIAGFNDIALSNKLFHETLKIDKNADEKVITENLEAYVSAYEDLKELDAVIVANLPFLTHGAPIDQVQHEFDRVKELHEDEVKRITFERDFFKMMAGFN